MPWLLIHCTVALSLNKRKLWPKKGVIIQLHTPETKEAQRKKEKTMHKDAKNCLLSSENIIPELKKKKTTHKQIKFTK